jgi:universal stress protein E
MASFSRILCVIDPTSKTQPALERATLIAKKSGASLDLLICYYNEYLTSGPFFEPAKFAKFRENALKRQKESLELMAAPLRSEGINVETTAVWDKPLHEGVIRQANALKSDVVFKDTHHHSGLNRSIFSNTDWNLIRACKVPLWLVKPGDAAVDPKIIVAIDPFNEHDKPATLDHQMLQLGQSIAEDVDGDLHAFHSFDATAVIAATAGAGTAFGPTFVAVPGIEDQISESHREKLEEISEQFGISRSNAHLASGLIQNELPALANEIGASVVIMGAISRNRLKRLYVGASAERTLEHLGCDLLVVKPEWFQSPVEMDVSDAD